MMDETACCVFVPPTFLGVSFWHPHFCVGAVQAVFLRAPRPASQFCLVPVVGLPSMARRESGLGYKGAYATSKVARAFPYLSVCLVCALGNSFLCVMNRLSWSCQWFAQGVQAALCIFFVSALVYVEPYWPNVGVCVCFLNLRLTYESLSSPSHLVSPPSPSLFDSVSLALSDSLLSLSLYSLLALSFSLSSFSIPP